MISGSYDHSLKVWDVKCGQCKMTLRYAYDSCLVCVDSSIIFCVGRGHNDAVLCLQFVGGTLVSGSSDQTIKVNYKYHSKITDALSLGMESTTGPV